MTRPGICGPAARRGYVEIMVMQRPHGHDLDSLVVLSPRDRIELHGWCGPCGR